MAVLELADYKKLRAVDGTNRDEALTLAVAGANALVERYLDLEFGSAQASATKTYPWNDSGFIQTAPFGEVTKVVLDEYTLPSENFRAGPSNAAVFTHVEVLARRGSPLMGFEKGLDKVGSVWPARSLVEGRFIEAEVTATFGWPTASIPADLKIAAAALVDQMAPAKLDADETGLAAQSIESYSLVYQSQEATNTPPVLPPAVTAILDNYRRVRF